MSIVSNPMMEKANDVKRDLSDLGSMAVDAAREKVGQLKDRVTDAYDQRCTQAKEIQDQGANIIKAHPFKAVLIAGAVGLSIGWLLTRRNSN
jgi:ElaB/YqjD/DUF883 family membrane-anchored ribosome-binding protein